jgi:predicted metalloprotease with PDZ domain
MNGLTAYGWKLVYNDTPNEMIKAGEERGKIKDISYSLGLVLLEDGTIRDAIFGRPAANAGIGPGMKVIAVNGRRWTPEILDWTLEEKTSPIELLVENNETFHTYAVDYKGGPRYPHLVRDADKPDGLAAVLAPRAAQ